MAIKFQYNKTSLQQQRKQLKVRERALPTIKSKESALRMEVKRTKTHVEELESKLEESMKSYDSMVALWSEFDPTIVRVNDVQVDIKRFAGVQIPELRDIDFEVRPFSLLTTPSWFMDGTQLIKSMASIGIEAEIGRIKLDLLDHARRKTTQKVNLFEKVQIPGYQDAIRKIKRYLEDEESLSKASQKIMRSNLEAKAKEKKGEEL